MPAFMSHWLSDKHAHAWPCATTHTQELARPATEAAIVSWAAELLADVTLNAGRGAARMAARFAVAFARMDV